MKEIYDRNIAKEWFKYGLSKDDDFFMRFMIYWLAFNWLYNERGERKEHEKISRFYEDHKRLFDKYDPFSDPAIEIFQKGPVDDGRDPEYSHSDLNYRGVKRNDACSLLLTMYCVRCNLFHGSKSLRCQRDQDLVRDSATILGGYLKALLEDDGFHE